MFWPEHTALQRVNSVGMGHTVTRDFNPSIWRYNIKIRSAVGTIHVDHLNHYSMSNTYHQIYLQFIFAVKYREALIHKSWSQTIFGVIGNLINETGCKVIIVNGVEDHVHCFLGLKPVVSIPELMKSVKAKSSKYINDHKLTNRRFEWQEGYGVFSYSHSQIENIYQYIANQEEHHKKKTFREEYLRFLKEFKVSFDERYIFDEII